MLAQYFSTVCMEVTKLIKNCCWNGWSRMREEPAHLLSSVKGHQQRKQRLMEFKLIWIHFSETSSLEKINKLLSHCSDPKEREEISALLFIRAGAIAEALMRIPHCQGLTRSSANSQPRISESTAPAATVTTISPFWWWPPSIHSWLLLWRPPFCFLQWRLMYFQHQPWGADDNKRAAWKNSALSWRTKLPLALHRDR